MVDLDGRRIVVTGASSGIGLEVARGAIARGAEVCLVARRREPLEQAAAQLGKRAWIHVADVGDPEAPAAIAAAAHDRWGGVDGLVNNAGVVAPAPIAEVDVATWDTVYAVNVRGPFLLVRDLLPLLSDGASVVNVSTTMAERAPVPGVSAYSSAKSALNQLTRNLAVELAPRVRVNAVMPAVVDTPIHATRGLTPEQVQAMGRLHPMGRVGRPSDVAAMVLFLLSDAASWMTGAIVPVDGGMMIK